MCKPAAGRLAVNEVYRQEKLQGLVSARMLGEEQLSQARKKKKKRPQTKCVLKEGPLFCPVMASWPTFIMASGGKQIRHNKRLTIKQRV